jgi:hypothetical protein
MTCRWIRPEAIVDPNVRQDAVEKGQIPAGIETLAYRGVDAVDEADTEDA